jgi:hypothetical protein
VQLALHKLCRVLGYMHFLFSQAKPWLQPNHATPHLEHHGGACPVPHALLQQQPGAGICLYDMWQAPVGNVAMVRTLVHKWCGSGCV